MTRNVTECAEVDALENDWELSGWWVGWLGPSRLECIPLGDSDIHILPRCRCGPGIEIINGQAMIVHNAFDGRR